MRVQLSIKNISTIHIKINELVFGCNGIKLDNTGRVTSHKPTRENFIKGLDHMYASDPLRDYGDAFRVVNKMVDLGFGYEITADHEDLHRVRFYRENLDTFGFSGIMCDQRINICMAALEAVGYDTKEFLYGKV